jgi:hypothetical protein
MPHPPTYMAVPLHSGPAKEGRSPRPRRGTGMDGMDFMDDMDTVGFADWETRGAAGAAAMQNAKRTIENENRGTGGNGLTLLGNPARNGVWSGVFLAKRGVISRPRRRIVLTTRFVGESRVESFPNRRAAMPNSVLALDRQGAWIFRCIKRRLVAKAGDRHVFARGLASLASTFAKAQKSLGFAQSSPPTWILRRGLAPGREHVRLTLQCEVLVCFGGGCDGQDVQEWSGETEEMDAHGPARAGLGWHLVVCLA